MSNIKSSFSAILDSLTELKDIENTIKSVLNSEAPLIEEISTYLLALGGKRIRPVIALLSAKTLGMAAPFNSYSQGKQLLDVSAGIELIHMATLLHDDIIDKSPLRRHKTSPYAKYGTDSTLLAGDFLLIRAFALCGKLDRFIIDATESACVALTEGEILETNLTQTKHSLDSCINIARKKTAALFHLAAKSAAYLSGNKDEVVDAMCDFGEKLGIAFQMVDDILDITSPQDLLGKPSGQDLRERKPSLVNVLWLKSESPLSKRLLSPASNDEDHFVLEAVKELTRSSIVAEAKQIALRFANDAQSCLRKAYEFSLQNSPQDSHQHRTANYNLLLSIIDYVLERMR